MGEVTTHVLDTAQGRPAAGMRIELTAIDNVGGSRRIKAVTTNHVGRTDAPLLTGVAMRSGCYELCFLVADYFRAAGVPLPEPPFLDHVPVRFAIADPEAHYHIPLLVSPWSYTTYRGG